MEYLIDRTERTVVKGCTCKGVRQNSYAFANLRGLFASTKLSPVDGRAFCSGKFPDDPRRCGGYNGGTIFGFFNENNLLSA